jgi:hypothetical protein
MLLQLQSRTGITAAGPAVERTVTVRLAAPPSLPPAAAILRAARLPQPARPWRFVKVLYGGARLVATF